MFFGIVIPCYNEALRLKLQTFCDFMDNDTRGFRICFVNDGSTDNTLDILSLIKRQYRERVEVIDLKQNKGKASAVRKGMQYFLCDDSIQYVGFMDADLSTNFKEFNILAEKISMKDPGTQMVFGSRPLRKGYHYERHWFRVLASVVSRSAIRRVVGLPIRDTQCGAKVFTSEMAGYCFKTSFQTRWLFDVELFLRLKKLMGSPEVLGQIKEVALREWKDVRGSKITLVDAFEMPLQLLKIWSHYIVFPGIRNGVRKLVSMFRGPARFKDPGA